MSDEMPHAETIAYRIDSLGWSEKEARETPIRPHNHIDGSVNVAKVARSLDAAPSKVQLYMREGLTLDDAVEKAWQAEGKL